MPKKQPKRAGKALLLGVGLDSDGHKRVTTGPGLALIGGSKETHEVMTEKAIKIQEKIKARGPVLRRFASVVSGAWSYIINGHQDEAVAAIVARFEPVQDTEMVPLGDADGRVLNDGGLPG